MGEKIELYNIEIFHNNIKIELIYFSEKKQENIQIFLEKDKKQKMFFKLESCKKKFGERENLNGIKAAITFDVQEYAKFKLKLKQNNVISEINWKNNQGKDLNFKSNEFIIFNKKKCIKINDNGIEIIKRNMLSKIKYNIKKIIYGIIKYKIFCLYRFFKGKEKYILINDRIIDGNDNGEALFKYICNNKLEIKKYTYYVIDKKNLNKVKDLKKVGKILKFGSIKHKIKYLNSKIIATSHIGNTVGVYNPFSNSEMELYRDIINKKVIFLQHGIIMSDFHVMFNRYRMVIDKIVVSTKMEYNSILNDGYFYDNDMIIKTGLARFDKLKNEKKNIILICMSWRKNIANFTEANFCKTQYFEAISDLLKSKKIQQLLDRYDYSIQFVTHPELNRYIRVFKKYETNRIKIFESKEINYSDIFNKCSMLVTDYSSIHFDLAYLKKPIIYYQFDEKDFFQNHTSNGKGKFDYRLNGFGDVTITQEKLEQLIENLLKSRCKMPNKYKIRAENTFFNIDNKNSERIYNEILKMMKFETKNYRFNNVQ